METNIAYVSGAQCALLQQLCVFAYHIENGRNLGSTKVSQVNFATSSSYYWLLVVFCVCQIVKKLLTIYAFSIIYAMSVGVSERR